jgi:antitoxin (DNA-binding transcriptional repressor) of toxin-antitoxin stability system
MVVSAKGSMPRPSNRATCLEIQQAVVCRITMNSKVTISQLQAQAPKCVRRAEQEGAVSIARHGRTVAFLISRDRMEAIIETLELMGNPKAMKAIQNYEAGEARMKDVSCLDEG